MIYLSPEERLAEIRRRVFRIDRLASMPQVVFRLVEAMGDSRTDAAALERIIESDQALASKVLSVANSAFYGFAQEVKTIRRAVVAIGFDELQLLALGSGLADVFNPRSIPERFDGQGLWTHCLAVSWTARALAVRAGHRAPGEIQMAGLLHDLGKLVMAIHMADDFEQICQLVDEGLSPHEAESRLGVPHTTVGRLLAAKWMLPEVHLTVIDKHHQPRPNGPYAEATCLVALANELTKELGFGSAWRGGEPDRAALLGALKLDGAALDMVADRAAEAVPELLDGWQQAVFGGG